MLLVEVARQLAQFVRVCRSEQLRHCRSVRLVGFRRPPPIHPRRKLQPAIQRECPDARLAGSSLMIIPSDNPVNIVTSNSTLNGVPEHGRRRHRADRDHRRGGPMVRSSVFVPSNRSATSREARLRTATATGPVADQVVRPGRSGSSDRRVRRVQPSQLRAADHRRQPDVWQDHEDATADR